MYRPPTASVTRAMTADSQGAKELSLRTDTSIKTLADIPRQYGARQPERMAIEYKQRRLNYGQLLSQSQRVAATLRREGIGKGDRVAFLGRNPDLYFLILYGCSLIGAVFVPLILVLLLSSWPPPISNQSRHTVCATACRCA